MSEARDNLDKLQREEPPKPLRQGDSTDFAIDLFNALKPQLPKWAIDLHDSGNLVCGEIGRQFPDAYTEHFGDGSHSVVITSGYKRFLYSIASDLSGALNTMPDGTAVAPILSPADTAMRIASLLEQYQNGTVLQGYALDTYTLPLPPEKLIVANRLTTGAGLFVVAHELGHVAQKAGPPRGTDWSEEQDADAFAFDIMVSNAPQAGLTWGYAGALLAISIYACLEHAGFKFAKGNSSPTKRVEWLNQQIRTDRARPYINPQDLLWTEMVFGQLLTAVEATLLLLSSTKQNNAASASGNGAGTEPPTAMQATVRAPTLAEIELKKLQSTNPPWEWAKDGSPLDRTKWLYKEMEPKIPMIQSQIASGRLVIGEVGLSEFSSSVLKFNDGSQAIIVSSGLLHVLQAVARFLHLLVKVRQPSGQIAGTIVPGDLAVTVIAMLFQDVAQNGVTAENLAFAIPGFWAPAMQNWELDSYVKPLDDDQFRLADELWSGAAIFILTTLIAQVLKTPNPPEGEFLTEKIAALTASFSVPWLGFRRSYAAALFAIRVQACMDRANSAEAPTSAARLAVVKAAPWTSFGSNEAGRYLTIAALYFDAVMDAVETTLTTNQVPVGINALPPLTIDKAFEDRLWARDCAAWSIAGGIAQVAKGNDRKENVLEVMLQLTDGRSEEVVTQLADSLFDRVRALLRVESSADREMALSQSEELDLLIAELPETIKAIFLRVRQTKSNNPEAQP